MSVYLTRIIGLIMIWMVVAPFSTAFALECAMKTPVQINITPKSQKIRYDFSRTLDEIQISHNHNAHSHYGFSHGLVRQGYMKADMKMEPVVKIAGLTYTAQGKTCLWYESINITLEITPQIVIAKEVYEDSCMKKAVLEHEMKHIKIDRIVANKYAKRMARKIQQDLSADNSLIQGPFSSSHKKKVTKKMQDRVFEIARQEYKKLEKERNKRQNQIDNADEYEHVSNQCPHYKNPLPAHAKPIAKDYYRRRSSPALSASNFLKKNI